MGKRRPKIRRITEVHSMPRPAKPSRFQGLFLPEITAHIQHYLGPIKQVYHELASKYVHIDVFWVPPNPRRPYSTLVTSGMSDLPMDPPVQLGDQRFAELMITLPADWKLELSDLRDDYYGWPFRLLKDLARMPHQYGTWLWWGHTGATEDPPMPYHPSTELCAAGLCHAPTVPPEFDHLNTARGPVAFFAVIPLYRSELEFSMRCGFGALQSRLEAYGILDVVELDRINVVPPDQALLERYS